MKVKGADDNKRKKTSNVRDIQSRAGEKENWVMTEAKAKEE
jgi:hypothetical protein